MRFIIICLLILAAMFIGHTVYYRGQADKLVAQALNELPLAPSQAYITLKPVLGYSNIVTLGKVSAAEKAFVSALEQKIPQALNSPLPAPEHFDQAAQALRVVQDMQREAGLDPQHARQIRIAIVKAAKESAPRIQAQGTLRSWDAMLSFFKNLQKKDSIPPTVFDDFATWQAQAEAVPRRPLGLRDATENAAQSIRKALVSLGLDLAPKTGPFVVPAPATLDDGQLIDAETSLNQAQSDLDRFLQLFKEERIPAELLGLKAKICYNKAALKLAHFQEHGPEELRSGGSGYMAEFMITANQTSLPTPAEMTSAFTQGAQSDFEGAQQLFPQASLIAPLLRPAYCALAAWSEAQLMALMQPTDQATVAALTQRSAGWLTGATGDAAAIAKAMHANKKVLIIVQVP